MTSMFGGYVSKKRRFFDVDVCGFACLAQISAQVSRSV